MEFIEGKVVQLKSGGPIMTIDYVVGSSAIAGQDKLLYEQGLVDGDVICQWFSDGRIHGKGFHAQTLCRPVTTFNCN